MQPYDATDPGAIGIFTILHDSHFEHRKWDGKAWHTAGHGQSLETAVRDSSPHGKIDYMRDYFRENTNYSPFIVSYVADLAGNQVEPREARRIGEQAWSDAPHPRQEQLELF